MIFLPGINRCCCPRCLWRSIFETKTMQERWDDQIEANLSASHFGRDRETREIGARMRWCPNNPANGGDGFDTGDGWTDRRWRAP